MRLSLAAQYQRNPLVFIRSDERQGAVIGRRFSSHLGIAYGLTDNLELALQLPVILSQRVMIWPPRDRPVSGTVLGTPLLQGQLVLARQSPSALGDIGLNLGSVAARREQHGLSQDPGPGWPLNAGVGFGHDFGSLLPDRAPRRAGGPSAREALNYTPRSSTRWAATSPWASPPARWATGCAAR